MATFQEFDGLIFHHLLNATKQGKIQWTDTADENTFRTAFKLGSIRLSKTIVYGDDQMGQIYYNVTILNKEGKPAVEYEPETAIEIERCAELYENARRSARDADAVINSIFEELSKR